jgi:hypothetical protein
VLFGTDPLNMYDAEATPLIAAFSNQPNATAFSALPSAIPMTKNPGNAKNLAFVLDGPDSAAIPSQEWLSIKGERSEIAHEQYLRVIGKAYVAESDGGSL